MSLCFICLIKKESVGLHYFVWLGVVIAWPKSGAVVLYTHIYAGARYKNAIYNGGSFQVAWLWFFQLSFGFHLLSNCLHFGENVYNKHGVWGVLLSLRNENIEKIWEIISPQLAAFDVIFGGVIRFPMRIEMMLFDILIYFGVLGLIIFILLIIKIVPSLKWSVPILVACFSGGIYEVPLGVLVFLLALEGAQAG